MDSCLTKNTVFLAALMKAAQHPLFIFCRKKERRTLTNSFDMVFPMNQGECMVVFNCIQSKTCIKY